MLTTGQLKGDTGSITLIFIFQTSVDLKNVILRVSSSGRKTAQNISST